MINNQIQGMPKKKRDWMRSYAIFFIILFGTYYIPIDGRAGFGILKFLLMASATIGAFSFAFAPSKAMMFGSFYLIWQFVVASLHPETWRWSTLLFSGGLVYTYVCLYNLIYIRKVFTIDSFIWLLKWLMMIYFIFCILQQVCIVVGIRNFPLINLTYFVNRGIGCHSLSMEPSTFARTMLVCYYTYVKCSEYKDNREPFSVKELFSGEHKWITIRFMWMMTTMGSGTAFACLIAFCLYFVRKNNALVMIPILMLGYGGLQYLEVEQLNRATALANAMTTLKQDQLEAADGSGASRISPLLNSFAADFSKSETWFGHGIDYARSNDLVIRQEATCFDDYGVIFYLIGIIFSFTCAYRLFSLDMIFFFMGVAGGAGGNIHYLWLLMILMTGGRYFYENRNNRQVICEKGQ